MIINASSKNSKIESSGVHYATPCPWCEWERESEQLLNPAFFVFTGGLENKDSSAKVKTKLTLDSFPFPTIIYIYETCVCVSAWACNGKYVSSAASVLYQQPQKTKYVPSPLRLTHFPHTSSLSPSWHEGKKTLTCINNWFVCECIYGYLVCCFVTRSMNK